MLYAAYLLLAAAAALGAMWLLAAVGPSWPGSVNDPSEGERRGLGIAALAMLGLSLGLIAFHLMKGTT